MMAGDLRRPMLSTEDMTLGLTDYVRSKVRMGGNWKQTLHWSAKTRRTGLVRIVLTIYSELITDHIK